MEMACKLLLYFEIIMGQLLLTSPAGLFRVSSHEPLQNSLTIPWLFPDHLVFFPDHETKYWRFITALTLILHAIWQITHQN